jgi:iron(III) transport system permease protein
MAIIAALLVCVPIAVVVASVFLHDQGTWAHLASTVLPGYVGNTVVLVLGVGLGVSVLGVGTAWLVTACRFPGRRALEWMLVLPLAAPAYVLAYAYTDFLQFSGPLQSALRSAIGWQAGEYWFPEVRSLPGALAMFSLALYPYVYLLSRATFLERSLSALEAGRLLGYGPVRSFFAIALPLARPAIAAGVALALMETLADFGTVSYFAVQTFTTGIYHAWLSLGDRVAAGQLSTLLLALVFAVLLLERWNRGRARFHSSASQRRESLYVLAGARRWLAGLVCAVPVLLGFVLPAGILLFMAMRESDSQHGGRMWVLIGNSFTLAGVAAVVVVVVALVMAYAARIVKSPLVSGANKVAGLGYALPGAVIAVGILVPVTRLDHALVDALASFGISTGLLLTGGILALVYAYAVRFMAIALQTVESGLSKITPSMEDAARSLGYRPAETMLKVHLPMLRGSVLTAGLIVFVDVMKELPATLVMRPFNFDTLAVQAYNYASDERLPEAAAASLVIVAVGLIPLLVLSRSIAKGRQSK